MTSNTDQLKWKIERFVEEIMRRINNHIQCKECGCEKSWHIWKTGYGYSCDGLCINPDCREDHMDCYWSKGLQLRPTGGYGGIP